MSEPVFQFQDVHIGGMPGFGMPDQFAVTGLQAGVNVVFGPNEIGKTTLSQAMQLLLWRDVPAGTGVHLHATVVVDGTLQERSRHLEELRVLGQDHAPVTSPLPGNGLERRNRYRIGLQDLLQKDPPDKATKGEFNALISREMHGVDLDAVSRRLDPLREFSLRGRNTAHQAVLAAKAAVRTHLEAQAEDQDLEAQILALEAELAGESDKVRSLQNLSTLDGALTEMAALLDLERPLLPFHTDASQLLLIHDHTAAFFQERLRARDLLAERLADASIALVTKSQALADLALGRPVTDGDLAEAATLKAALPNRIKELVDAEQFARQARDAWTDWAESSEWLDGLAETLPPVTEAMLLDAAHLARELETARATEDAWHKVAADLGRRLEDGQALSSAQESIEQLETWLGADARLQARREALDLNLRKMAPGFWLLIGLTVAAAAGAAFTLALTGRPGHGLLWPVILALVTVTSLATALIQLYRQDPSQFLPLDRDQALCQEIQSTVTFAGHAPGQWTAPAVRLWMAKLLEQELAFRDRDGQEALRKEVASKAQEQAEHRSALLEDQSHTIPGLEQGPALLMNTQGYLYLVVAQVRKMQELRGVVMEKEKDAEERTHFLEELQKDIRSFLTRFGRQDGAGLQSTIDRLHQDLGEALRLQEVILALEGINTADAPKLVEAEEEVRNFLAPFGVDTEEAFRTLMQSWELWRQPHATHQAKVDGLQAIFHAHPSLGADLEAYLAYDPATLADREQMITTRRTAVAVDRATLDEELAGLTAKRKELVDCRVALETYSTRGELAAAIADHENAVRTLEEQRLGLVARRTLGLILERQTQLAEDMDRPPVLKRASQLFLAFTDRYELIFSEGRFLAKEGQEKLELHQLSDGTRVQLLLAVRLAFVEQEETLQLPLFLDEILGNSDDTRADDIVRTLLHIAGTGRQVFYFTAQMDEVNRWMEAPGASIHQVNLADIRSKAKATRIPVPAPPPEILSAAGRTLEDYARALDAAGPTVHGNLYQQAAWLALADGDESLLEDLQRHSVRKLGALKRLATARQEPPYPRLLATIKVLEEAQQRLRDNLGKPLSKEEFLSATVPSMRRPTKDKLLPALEQCQGNLAVLFASGSPLGVEAKHAEALKDWAEDQGFWNPAASSREEILVDLLAGFSHLLPEVGPGWAAVRRFVIQAAI